MRAGSVVHEEIPSDIGICIKNLWQNKGIKVRARLSETSN